MSQPNSMETCILVRHGEIANPTEVFPGRTINVPLSEKGEKQIESIARQIGLLAISICKIYSSPLYRTMKTAEILSRTLHAPIAKVEDLIEVDIPALVGKPVSLRTTLHANNQDEYSGPYVKAGNESRVQITERMLRAFQGIRTENIKGTPIIVSHGDPLAFLLYRLRNPTAPLLSTGQILEMGYGLERGQAAVLTFNDQNEITKEQRLSPLLST